MYYRYLSGTTYDKLSQTESQFEFIENEFIFDFKTSLNGNKDLYTCDYAYNTRCTSFKGLPVGPICSSGKVSITSSINIKDSSYYYFVADCKGKVYFNTNSSGHYNTINKLKADGNWCS